MRTARSVAAALGSTVAVCAALTGCSSTVQGTAVAVTALDRVLPTGSELSETLDIGSDGFMGQLVQGDADTLLRGVDRSEADPADCVGASYRLQQMVYEASPVRAVATRPWAGGDWSGPSVSAFLGVVELASAADAQAFFAATVDNWRRCDGATMVLSQPDHGNRALSKITDVAIDGPVVSAVVLREDGPPVQRALGVASDCIVDVEISDLRDSGDGADGAVGVAAVMLGKLDGG